MKIVLCNKYFFLNGGTEKYLSDIMRQLSLTGHIPIPFSVNYAGSWDSAYGSYFLDPPGAPDQTHLEDIRLTPANWPRFLDRSIYSLEARKYLSRLLKDVGGAEIAYILNIYNYMSPSIIHTFHKHRIPVVMRLGDYHLLCPSYLFLREGKPCTLCISGAYYHGLRYRCVKRSYPASAVRVLSMMIHKWLRIYHLAAAFVVPCLFMKSKLVEGGLPAERIHMIRSPVSMAAKPLSSGKKNYILYFGRISYEKGLDLLIRAYQQLSPESDLILVGRSYDGEIERLQKLIDPEHAHCIQFQGFKTGDDLSRLISEALLSVLPSRWYDNAPLSIYESFLHGTPVIASRIGGIPEQINEGVNGRLFSPDSEEELQKALHWMLSDRERLRTMGQAGREYVSRELSIKKHAEELLNLFASLTNGKN